MIPSTKCRDLLLPEMLGPATGPGDPRYEIPNARGVGRRDLGCLKIPHQNCRTEGVFHHHHDPCFFCNKQSYIPKNIRSKSATNNIKKGRLQLAGGFPGLAVSNGRQLVASSHTRPVARIPSCSMPWSLGRRLIKWVMLLENIPGTTLRARVNEWDNLNFPSTM